MAEKTSGAWPPQPPPQRKDLKPRPKFRYTALFVSLLVYGYLTVSRLFNAKPPIPETASRTIIDDPMNPWDSVSPTPPTPLHHHPSNTLR
jgi:hypothetical protein